MNHIQGSVNSQIKTNISTDNDSADIVFLGESPGFKNVPVDSSPINSKNINVGFQNLNNLHVTPTKQKSTGHYNNTPPKSFNNSPQLVSPKYVNNLCNGSPNFRAAGPMSPTNTSAHLLPKSPTVCRYQITNSPSYKISNRRNSKKQTQVDQTDGSITKDKTSPSVLRAEDLWDKMQSENKQTTSSNSDIKNHQTTDNDNLIVIDPETTPVTKNDSLPTTATNLSAEKKGEENEDDKRTKEIEKELCAVEMNIKEKDEIEIERRPSSRESIESNGSQSKKKKRGRPKKQPPEIYIENLETGEGRDIDSPISDISSKAAAFQAAVFPICDDKTDKDYVPASDQKKHGRSKSRRNSQGKQSNFQKNKTENRDDDTERTCESEENKKDDNTENKADRKRPWLSEGDKSEMSVTSEETVQDNSLITLNDSSSSLGNNLHKGVDEKQVKSFKSLSTSVRNARMNAKRARYAKIMSQGKTSEKEINNETPVVNSNIMELEQDSGEVLKYDSEKSQDMNGRVNDKNETNCDSVNDKTFDVKTHAESSSLSANNFQTSHKKIYEKKSRPDNQKRKGVVKNIGSVISSLFGENFMSMADSSGFVVNVRLDVQKKTSEADNPNSTHKEFTNEEEKDSGCLSANIFKDVSSSSDPQEGCSHSISKKSKIDKIDPKTFSNAELCAILKKRISDHPVIDNEMKAAVMDSIQYAKKLLDS